MPGISDRIYENRLSVLLLSFMLLLFGDLLTPPKYDVEVDIVLLIFNIYVGLLLFRERPRFEKLIMRAVTLVAIGSLLLVYFLDQRQQFVFATAYTSYFLILSWRLFQEIINPKEITGQTVAGVFCGFILLAVLSSIVFASVYEFHPDAFAGTSNESQYSDFLYFSFITLLTIGYGDITPSIEVTRQMVMLLGLIGHFYTVFVTAIIVGKYASNVDAQHQERKSK